MAKKEQQQQPNNARVVQIAQAQKLPMLNAEGEKTLIEGLTKLGAKFEITSIRANDINNGKTPFARKVKVLSFTFLTDLTN